jgi:hypothetical protein
MGSPIARMSVVNWVPAAILCSPAHRLLSRRRLLLGFGGRRTGRRYVTPVNYLRQGRELLISTDSRWAVNLDGGAPVQLRLRGRRVLATARTVRDPEQVAAGLTALITDHPPYGRWARVRVGQDGTPDPDDVRAEAAGGRVLIRVELAGEASA